MSELSEDEFNEFLKRTGLHVFGYLNGLDIPIKEFYGCKIATVNLIGHDEKELKIGIVYEDGDLELLGNAFLEADKKWKEQQVLPNT